MATLQATPRHRPAGLRGTALDGRPRVGIVNLMPHAQQYERWLMPQLDAAPPVETVWIRVNERGYSLDEPFHIHGRYRPYADVVIERPLDGLIVTGSAVEHLPYEQVRFLPEVAGMVRLAAADRIPILGLCWGALAVGHLLFGLPKKVYPQKVSGIYLTDRLVDDGPIAAALEDRFWSTHSSFAGFDEAALDAAPGVRAVAGSTEVGTVIAESCDHRVVLHIGHPEYADPDRPLDQWRHSLMFFASWVGLVYARANAR